MKPWDTWHPKKASTKPSCQSIPSPTKLDKSGQLY
jgi:hypothetical protein